MAHKNRLQRIFQVGNWAITCFGRDEALNIKHRGIRLAEEAIEVAQAAGVDKEMLHYLIEHVYKNPPGQLKQELGGLGVTILAMGHAAGIHVDQAEIDEIHRIVSKDPEHFRKRNEVKNKLGFKA